VLTHPLKENNPLFLCFGADGRVLRFEFRFIHHHALELFNAEPRAYSGVVIDFNDPNPASIQQLYYRLQGLRSDPVESEVSLMQHLHGITSLGCLKKGDMVSITLNAAHLPLFYSGHLETREDVTWVMAILTIASGDVLPLVARGTKLRVPDNHRTKIVSWVDQPGVLVREKRIPLIDGSSITAVTKEYIELDILLFTDLPKKPSQASMEKASTLARLHSLDELKHSLSVGEPKLVQDTHKYLQSHSMEHDFTQTWLALALDCGIDWIKRLPLLLIEQTAADQWTWGQFATNPLFSIHRNKLEAVAIDLLSLIEKNEKNTPDFAKSYLNPTVKFFECLLDTRLKILTGLPRRLCIGSSDWAIVERTFNTSWIAVPAAVAGLPLSWDKVWVIEAFDPAASPERPQDHWPDMTKDQSRVAQEDIWPVLDSDFASRRAPRNDERGTWRLRHRRIIFGCQSIVPDGQSVILLRKQKIYGAENYDLAAMLRAASRDRGVPPSVQGALDGKVPADPE
jgi:hypothetical protein